MKILYFAWIKTKTGKAEEYINDSKVTNINSLFDLLSVKYPELKKFIKNKNLLRVAVNLNYATKNKKLNHDDEIAIFPPVSGG